ncbi:MAG: enoyl-CoA hydratase [Burkholderiaceae bacterium]|nr:enoyl-CoA hydratase [Burkholderiaceae bacterium]
MSQVFVELRSGVLHIVFNRPEKKNALTLAMYEAANAAFERAASDAEVKAVLIAGEGGSFTAGNDLQDFVANPPQGEEAPVLQFLRHLVSLDKPLVAAAQGFAVGVGTTLLMHCDLVYAADDAQFVLPFVQLGLCPEAASSLLLPQIAGYQRAAEKLLLGEPFDAAEALAMGLVNRVLPVEGLREFAVSQAEKFARLPAPSVRATKRLLKGLGDQGPQAVLARMRSEEALFQALLGAPAAREAMMAFLQKRKPDFSAIG